MTIQCPHCNSLNVETLNYGRTTGTVVMSVSCVAGAIIGAAAGPVVSIVGTVIGGLLAAWVKSFTPCQYRYYSSKAS